MKKLSLVLLLTFVFAFIACGDYENKDDLALTITSPNGGENWMAASSRNITWTTTGTVPNVKLEYTTNDTSWTVITASTANTGTHSWTVPDTPSTTCIVRITDVSNAAITDISNTNFTISNNTVTDYDGNVYHTVIIGTQVWMVENLKTTHYRNGTAIPNVTDVSAWNSLTAGAYCNYNNNANNVATYGRLYNWYAVNDSRNIAPEGWHVATDEEWTGLTDLLGGESVAGGKLKEAGTLHWPSPNTGATNEVGFSALGGGYRSNTASYIGFGGIGSWWCSTESSITDAWARGIFNDAVNVDRGGYYEKMMGFSVRCVRD